MARKKKSPGLSSLNRAIALAINVDANNAPKARECIQSFRKNAESTIKSMNIPTFFEINKNSSVKQISRELLNFGSDETGVQLMRSLLFGFWDKGRICYSISTETLSFMDANFPIEEMEFSAPDLIETLCRHPVYLEFPQGSPLVGAFLGCARIPEEISLAKNSRHQLLASLIYVDGAEVLLSVIINESVKKIFNGVFPNESSRFLYKAIFYIGYLLLKKDSSEISLVS